MFYSIGSGETLTEIQDPISKTIAVINGNSPEIHEIEPGVYETGDFSFDGIIKDVIGRELAFDERFYCFGVADDLNNILEYHLELKESEKKFVVSMTPILKENQPSEGGWRWHKWGEYIGKHDPQHEYLYDEEDIDKVYYYRIYWIND